jgi:multidrug efflux system outer membrane protein
MKQKKFLCLVAAFCLFCYGCMVGPKYQRPAISTPDAYSETSELDTLPIIKWFDLFKDTVLLGLIKQTLSNNRDLMTATARIEEAQYNARIFNTGLFPSFAYNVQAGGGHAGTEAQKVSAGFNTGYLNATGLLNWELDIWGKVRRATRSAQAVYLSEKENRNAIIVSLVAQVASSYFLLLDLDNRLNISERTLQARKINTRINTDRFEKGYSAELDKLQAIQQETIAASAIPGIQLQIVQTENSIRTLMGMSPGHILRGDSLYTQVLPPSIPTGLPSQLLERRPDVRSAEQALRAQFEQIGVATANLYPSLNLTGILGFASPQLSTLLTGSGFIANGFASLTGPIFQFNKNRMVIESVKQRTQQVALQYEQTVLVAMGQVDNALAANRTFEAQYVSLFQSLDASRRALDLSQARYDYGYTSYLEVLTQENILYDTELETSMAFAQRLSALVDLYRALGGGWDISQP